MICYKYYCFNSKGNQQDGYINCSGLSDAKRILRRRGLYLHKSYSAELESEGLLGRLRFLQSISIADRANALWQLASLLNAHVPITTALDHLADSLKNKKLQRIFSLISKDVCNGSTLSEAFAKHSCFGETMPHLIASGEESGTLSTVLQRSAKMMFYTSKLSSKVMSILAYPFFLFSIILIFSAVLLTFIVPKMCEIFIENGVELPALTQFLLDLSKGLKTYWPLIFIGPAAFYAFIRWRCQQQRCLRILSAIFFRIPVVGTVFHLSSILRFSRGMALMLSGGTMLPEAILAVSKTVRNILMQDALMRVHAQLCKGVSLTEAMKQEKQFPALLVCMLATGEKSGNLEYSLEQASLIYEEQLEGRIAVATAMLEPIVMLMMGIMVGILVFALVLPMAKMAKLGAVK